MSRVTKPCPGCGRVHGGRAADKVCIDCQERLKFYDDLIAAQKGQLKTKEVTPVLVPQQSHWLPYIQHADHGSFDGTEQHGHRFQRCFLELALGLSEPAADIIHFERAAGLATYSNVDSGGRGDVRLMQPGVARCLKELYDTANTIAQAAFADGHATGLKLLMQVRDGQISVNDAEVKAAAVAQKALQRKGRR